MKTSVRCGPAWDPGNVLADVEHLLAGLVRQPWGRVEPSVYETARLVTLAPWLDGHGRRLRFVLAAQRPDGGWGPPGGYAVVPTLSAVEALLTVLERGGPYPVGAAELSVAAGRGLVALAGWLGDTTLVLPDTPAVDLIVPALVEAINVRLGCLSSAPSGWRPDARLGLPSGMTTERLRAVRRLISSGATVPAKLAHSFEVVGPSAGLSSAVGPGRLGTVGASPAATAAWIGAAGAAEGTVEACRHLAALASRDGGPVPCPVPITVFERSWVVSELARAGVPFTAHGDLAESLVRALGPTGAATGPGLPTDADTTAVVLYALGHLGTPTDPAVLWGYDTGGHFVTWPGEDGASVTTNAHVLDAFGQHLAVRPGAGPRYRRVLGRLSRWLAEQQRADGAWQDRWHASPYYATACVVLALHEYGRGPVAAGAVDRAVDWVLGSQRSDGSWGRWSGTVEETAYALHVLLGIGRPLEGALNDAVLGGYVYLRQTAERPSHPALWHGKELYVPSSIVESFRLGAIHLAASRADLEASAVSF
ncbi:prenyltransferase/squalene oxidase repeat-containing protein [Micromonospora sp. NPDC050397]|uniref:prenyltransferase/squalene oxidase repeat-containing protein n=1 Tax=Micromonospora sp. NPDC050397 TaxID=3364279 RepID=UPI003850C18F